MSDRYAVHFKTKSNRHIVKTVRANSESEALEKARRQLGIANRTATYLSISKVDR